MSVTAPAYSPDGYLAALITRGERTLLVEGDDDQEVMEILVGAFQRKNRVQRRPLVDSADIVKPVWAGMGNRERVEYIHRLAELGGIVQLSALVDREFREFCSHPPLADMLGKHRVAADRLYWTRGHSVENYLIDWRYIELYLEVAIGAEAVATYGTRLAQWFPSIVRHSCAMGIGLFRAQVLSRSAGIAKRNLWNRDLDGVPTIDVAAVRSELTARGIGGETCDRIASIYARSLSDLLTRPVEFARWLGHGHILYECIWTGIGFAAASLGIAPEIADKISTGDNNFKWRILSQHWANECLEGIADRPQGLIDWICET